MLYGRSLSLCISHIINDKVKETEVAGIITSTCARNRKEFEKIVNNYKEDYWYENPEIAAEIALRLYDSGMIIQPRLDDDYVSQALYNVSIWANSYDEAMSTIKCW